MSSSDDDDSKKPKGSLPPSMGGVAKITSQREEDPRFRSMQMENVASIQKVREEGDKKYRSVGMIKPPHIGGGGLGRSNPRSEQKSPISKPPFIRDSKPDYDPNADIRGEMNLNLPLEDVHSRPPSNWLVKEDSLRAVPTYYPLEKSSRYVTGKSSEEIAHKISDCCRIMSVQADFDDTMGTACLRTSEHVEIQVSLWKGTAPRPDCVIVETQRRRGDAVTYHKYCRNILDAADGDFDAEIFRQKEELEVEYCRKAEQMLLHGKKPEPAKGSTEHENSLLALEIAASLLKKDRMDARQLGMESLCLLTDPIRTGMETALLASRVVLLGSTQDENVDDVEDDPCGEWGIREAVLALVQFGRLGEGGDFGVDQDIDSDDDDAAAGHPEEQQHNDMLHNLALAVLANALEVLENHGNQLAPGSESPSSVANALLDESKQRMDRDLLETLLSKLQNAERKPHDACLSAQCLGSLCEASEEARRKAKELQAKQIVLTALDVGRRTHVKLETETNKVKTILLKADDEVQQE